MKNEPVALSAAILVVVNAVIMVAVAFGLNVTEGQIVALNALAAAVLGLWTRSKVSPVDTTPTWTPEMDA